MADTPFSAGEEVVPMTPGMIEGMDALQGLLQKRIPVDPNEAKVETFMIDPDKSKVEVTFNPANMICTLTVGGKISTFGYVKIQ